jgi:hypothetical protein
MATLSVLALTLNDWAKRQGTDKKTAAIIELLSQSNEVLDDMRFKEGNLPTGEQATIRTGLPSVVYRLMNQGVPASKSTTAQITENAATLEARSEVDADIAKLNGDVNAFRLSESMAFLEAMNQQMASTLFYGTNANPEEFVGFAPRYNDLSAANAQNILDAGGTGSDRFRAYMDRYSWKNGLMVKDWRYAVRIANVDISDLVGQTGTQASTAATAIIKLMTRAIDRLPSLNNVSLSFYANRTIVSHLRIAAQDKSDSVLNITESTNQFGQTIFTTTFMGIPVRIVDALTEAEAQVT